MQMPKVLKISWSSFDSLKEILKKVIDEGSYNPVVRKLAEEITHGTHFGWERKIYSIARFVKARYSFNRDPGGREMLYTPENLARKLLMGQGISGDCDDVTVLLLSLYKSINIEGQMMFVSPKVDPPYTHVFVVAFEPKGKPRFIDLLSPNPDMKPDYRALEHGPVRAVSV